MLEAEVAANAYRAIPIDGEREGASLVDGLRIEDPGLALAERAAIVGQRLSVLDERDREILRLRFGDDLIQTEIGERIGVSQMQVSRLIRRSLAALHEIAEQAESSAS